MHIHDCSLSCLGTCTIQFEPNQREGLHFIHVEHLHDHINSLWGDVCVHKTSSTFPLFIIVHVPRQESEQSCICICERKWCS
jgi:hypothetical protein